MEHRTSRVAFACALVIGVTASAAVSQHTDGQQPDGALASGATAAPAPASTPPGAPPTASTSTPYAGPTPPATPAPSATPTAAQTGAAARYPSLPDGGVGADLSRNLGTFPSVEAAIAAAKAASLPSEAYGVAIVRGEVLAINAAGLVFHLAYLGGSGSPQRPPKGPGRQ